MKIDKINRVLQIYNDVESNKVGRGGDGLDRDSVKFSEDAQDYQFALQKLREVPDIRMDKVEELKKRIDAKTYDISGREIAERIYQRINFDKKV
ncbi:MAG: flagellar biosynthesis anti-sigma factor FlgM [Tissierellia bacterium]|nr:flagellar biosynthesis anti-sigma factor FlgM [Tissierellia bacterium]